MRASSINGQAYTLIHDLTQLAGISAPALDANGQWALDADGSPIYTIAEGHYALAGNISASGPTFTAPPIIMLRGTLAGLGNTIDNLSVREPPSGAYVQRGVDRHDRARRASCAISAFGMSTSTGAKR